MGRTYIDQDLCTGDGLCVEIAPAVFYMRDDGLAYVMDPDDPGAPQRPLSEVYVGTQAADYDEDELGHAVKEASEECPGACIFIEQEDGSWEEG
jgi:ferredoxin